MPKSIAVLIPVLNGMPYLREMLSSLETQTCRDFTVILWDNGSTDGTVEEVLKWIPSRLPGRLITGNPLPLHECLARMVEISETEFCARMDADDICHPDRLCLQMDEFHRDPMLLALGTQASYITASGEPTGKTSQFPLEYYGILSGMLMENQILHPTVMFRRQAVLEVGNYAIVKPCEDYDLWMKVATFGKVRNLSKDLLSYRIHDKSIIATARISNELEEPNRLCLELNCEALFGVEPQVYGQLRRKNHPIAAIPLLRAAWEIAIRSNVSIFRVLMSPPYIFSARCLTGMSDYVSRAIWGLFDRMKLIHIFILFKFYKR